MYRQTDTHITPKVLFIELSLKVGDDVLTIRPIAKNELLGIQNSSRNVEKLIENILIDSRT